MQTLGSDFLFRIFRIFQEEVMAKIKTYSKRSELGFDFNAHLFESVPSMLRSIYGEVLSFTRPIIKS